MLYELRIYRCMAGRKPDVMARFRDHTMKLFKKHGIEVPGFWETVVGELDELVYICRFASWDAREAAWAAFGADPAWQQAREDSHKNGLIVEHIRTSLLKATDFSPAV